MFLFQTFFRKPWWKGVFHFQEHIVTFRKGKTRPDFRPSWIRWFLLGKKLQFAMESLNHPFLWVFSHSHVTKLPEGTIDQASNTSDTPSRLVELVTLQFTHRVEEASFLDPFPRGFPFGGWRCFTSFQFGKPDVSTSILVYWRVLHSMPGRSISEHFKERFFL